MRRLLAARSARRARPGARGFTLIELLAVILIIGLLVAALTPILSDAFDTSEAEACTQNLRKIHQGMVVYKTKFGRAPAKSGVAFFAELITSGALENTPANARTLTCPAVDPSVLTQGDREPREWWTSIDAVDGGWSTYAGRDMRSHPLRKFLSDGDEILVADDNDPEMNHKTTTNALYSNGSVETFELAVEREKGTLGPDEILIVGPDSPIEALRKLSLD